jgi:hypothetical protein
VYDGERYLTLTGRRLDGASDHVPERQSGIDAAYALIFDAKKAAATNGQHDGRLTLRAPLPAGACPLPLTEAELQRWGRMGGDKTARIISLWNGDASAYDHDDSRADAALCAFLIILTGGDRGRAEALMGMSALGQREKWTGREDYRQRTLDKATEGYQPDGPSAARSVAGQTAYDIILADMQAAISRRSAAAT